MDNPLILIDKTKLINNYLEIRNYLMGKEIIAVVKDNAYGLGIIAVTRLLYQCGCQYFAVSSVYEGLSLRKEFNDISIIILGYVEIEQVDICSQNQLIICVHDEEMVDYLTKYMKPIVVHIKVDTGLNRLGLKQKNILNIIEKLTGNNNVYLEGIFTHIGQTKYNENNYLKQVKLFNEIIKQTPYSFKIIHVSNSFMTVKNEPNLVNTNYVRIGLLLYGYYPQGAYIKKIKVEPVLKLVAKIISIKHVKKGERIGYGNEVIQKDSYIAVIPMGYSKGLIRKNKGRKVEINKKYYRIIGNISMDLTFILVDENVKVGDYVVLIGDKYRYLEKYLNTIIYEVICLLSNKITRVYIN